MKTVSIQELHAKTDELLREVSAHGEILVTDHGRTIAKISPVDDRAEKPYFARRKPSSAFLKLDRSGKTGRGVDATVSISNDREDKI
jgi:prevent-host-death family protein